MVSLLGKSTGRVSALARGARKSVRRFGGGLGLGATGEACLRERPGAELMSLESFDVSDARLAFGADLACTAHAAYALELCERLCAPRQVEPEIFVWLEEFLALLGSRGATVQRLRAFELGLLRRLGLGLSIEVCVACGRPAREMGDDSSRWQPERGGLVCRACARSGLILTADVRRTLLRFLEVALDAADAQELTRDQNAGCRQMLLEAISLHLTSPLKSLEFINKMGGSP